MKQAMEKRRCAGRGGGVRNAARARRVRRIDGKCILEGKAALLLEHGVEMTMPGEAGDYIDRGWHGHIRGGGR